jgi:pyridoxal phosphate enzyme (YggS family)
MNSIQENLNRINERIDWAAHKSGRKLSEIVLVAVTKNVPAQKINQAIEAGVTIIGENRVQEFREKKAQILPVETHMIGHLQTNKVKYAVELFNMVQSVDTYHLATEINRRCQISQKEVPILLEINTSGESTKYGYNATEVIDVLERISKLESIKVKGLMTIGPFTEKKEEIRLAFQSLKKLFININKQNIPKINMDILSMGMSSDFEIAIEEGSTMVRIGSAIFGPRSN